MKDNAFVKIIELMRKQGKYYNPPTILLAEVSHVKVNPDTNILEELKIKVNEIEIDQEHIIIADHLLPEYHREYANPKEYTDDDGEAKKTQLTFDTDEASRDGMSFRGEGVANGNTGKDAITTGLGATPYPHGHPVKDLPIEVERLQFTEQPFFVHGRIIWKDTLRVHDIVAVMPTYDGQTFIILARVVRLTK